MRKELATFEILRATHPDAHCELDHKNAFELLCATVMSAQTTDIAVNRVTPALFARFPDARSMAQAEPRAIEDLINHIGMFRQKAKNLVGLAKKLVADHDGQVPNDLASLVALPGVGRKTANVVLGVAFGQPEGVVVDTHVSRLSQRLGWTQATTPEEIEAALVRIFPKNAWDTLSHTLIFHGRRVCFARKPQCETCSIAKVCPSAFEAEHVGRKHNKGVAAAKKAPTKKAPTKKAPTKKAPTKKAPTKKAPTAKRVPNASRAPARRAATTK